MKPTTQPFKDGVVNIYKVDNISDPGNKPKQELVHKAKLRYDERTVGMSRYWVAMQAQAKVEQMIRVPRLDFISTQDVAILKDGEQYRIIQIQYPVGVEPHSMDLSLERLEAAYEIS